MASANDTIVRFLTEHGPQSSSEVGGHLRSQGWGDAAARKAIQRTREPIRKLAGLTLPNRQRVLYLEGQYGRQDFWQQLRNVLVRSGSTYGVALAGLAAYGGSVPSQHFLRTAGAPTRLRGQVGAERVLSVLVEVGLLEVLDHGTGPVVQFSSNTGLPVQPYSYLKARLIAEDIVLEAMAGWLRNNGLVSFGKVETRNATQVPEFACHGWDLTAPSYLRALTKRTDGGVDPGFVVADVILNEDITEEQSGYFVRKALNVADRRGMRPSLAFFIAARFEREGLRRGRRSGLVFTTPDLLFGADVGAALKDLIRVLSDAAAHAAARPEVVEELFSRLGKIEGAAGNLRGPLFEMIAGHVVREVEGTSIDIGVEAISDKGTAEIDVLRVKTNQEVWAYECKGILSDNEINKDAVDRWLGTTIPRIHQWVSQQTRFRGSYAGFEFWTTGRFTPEALALLQQRSAATKRYEIGWRDGPAVEEYVKKARNRRLLDVLREQYTRHPMVTVPTE